MSKDFYDLCYDQYRQEMNEADTLYQKAGVMLVALPVLAGAIVYVGRIDLINLALTRVDSFLYHAAAVVGMLAIGVSVVHLFLCIYPKQYKTLASMNVWHAWREEYQAYLKSKKKDAKDDPTEPLDEATIKELCSRLVEAQPANAQINEKRRIHFQKSVLMAGIASIAIGFQALFYLLLQIQGV
jgi:hypothetical protein